MEYPTWIRRAAGLETGSRRSLRLFRVASQCVLLPIAGRPADGAATVASGSSVGGERTGYGPTMSFDHDNGILTALKIGF